MADRYSFQPGDRVRGSFDSGTVVSVEGHGRYARVLVRWDEIDAAGYRRRAADLQCKRFAWTLTKIDGHLHTVNPPCETCVEKASL